MIRNFTDKTVVVYCPNGKVHQFLSEGVPTLEELVKVVVVQDGIEIKKTKKTLVGLPEEKEGDFVILDKNLAFYAWERSDIVSLSDDAKESHGKVRCTHFII